MDSTSMLAGLPATLREELLEAFEAIVRNYREQRWEPSELNGGKLCEVVYSILRGHIDASYPARASKPSNMVDACRGLEQASSSGFPRSVRIQIPRLLIGLYEVRNNRGVGHVGGDVNPNHMDARLVLETSKWILAELVRVFHNLEPSEASRVVDSLVERTVPMVWSTGDVRRVLRPELSKKDQSLLLLYSANGCATERELCTWVEHSNASVFRRDIIKKLHKERLVNYDDDTKEVVLSPTGSAYVEDRLPLDL